MEDIGAMPVYEEPQQMQSVGGRVFDNLAANMNSQAQREAHEQHKKEFAKWAMRGKVSAKIAYDGSPRLENDPSVKEWLPDPENPGWIDEKTGQFDYIKWSQHFAVGMNEYRKNKRALADEERKNTVRMELEKYKQENMNRRNRESTDAQIKMASDRAELARAKAESDQKRQEARDWLDRVNKLSLIQNRDRAAILHGESLASSLDAKATEFLATAAKYQQLLEKAKEVPVDKYGDPIRTDDGYLVPVNEQLIQSWVAALVEANEAASSATASAQSIRDQLKHGQGPKSSKTPKSPAGGAPSGTTKTGALKHWNSTTGIWR